MESNSRIAAFFSNLGDKIAEQQWFQQLKAKWDELDAQSRLYLKAAFAVFGTLFLAILIISSIYSVYAVKKEYREKADLLLLLQNSNDEFRRLKETTSTATSGGGSSGPITPFLESQAVIASIDKSALSVGPEKAGSSSDTIKESLVDVTLKHVNIRQIVRFSYNLENGSRPIKLRNLNIDTKSDPAGYMDATLSISVFTLINK